MAEDAHHGIVAKDAGDALSGLGRAVGDHDLAGVLREADPDAAAVVEADPACA